MTDRRFIEETFPVKEVSAISAREKNIRQSHISNLHIWWARRPLTASRSTAYAALTPATDDVTEWQQRRDFIVELSRWENSLNRPVLEKARRDILEAHAQRLSAEQGKPVTVEDIETGRAPGPRVLDPFSGGGAIPLEALRLGCETYASDYNPVAVLLLKATLEYPQKFGRPVEVEASGDLFGGLMTEKRTVNPLLEAVKKWGSWVLEEARRELSPFYPHDPNGSIPVGYIWARTIPCQNPTCGAEIPLMRQFWLAKKPKKKVSLCPDATDGQVNFRIIGDGYAPWPEGFDPKAGTVYRAVATCPVCGAVIDAKTTRRLFQEGKAGQRMVAVVLKHPRRQGKIYRLATEDDEALYQEAEAALQAKREQLMLEWGVDPVPNEPIPMMSGTFNVPIYGMNTWGSLFNTRQQLALITFAEKVRRSHEQIVAENADLEFAKATVTYLALLLSKMSDWMSVLTSWQPHVQCPGHTFTRHALPMLWDYHETAPLGGSSGSWTSTLSRLN